MCAEHMVRMGKHMGQLKGTRRWESDGCAFWTERSLDCPVGRKNCQVVQEKGDYCTNSGRSSENLAGHT